MLTVNDVRRKEEFVNKGFGRYVGIFLWVAIPVLLLAFIPWGGVIGWMGRDEVVQVPVNTDLKPGHVYMSLEESNRLANKQQPPAVVNNITNNYYGGPSGETLPATLPPDPNPPPETAIVQAAPELHFPQPKLCNFRVQVAQDAMGYPSNLMYSKSGKGNEWSPVLMAIQGQSEVQFKASFQEATVDFVDCANFQTSFYVMLDWEKTRRDDTKLTFLIRSPDRKKTSLCIDEVQSFGERGGRETFQYHILEGRRNREGKCAS